MKKGFTLVEILMATAVLAVLMGALTVTLTSTFKNARKAAAIGAVNSEGQAAMKSMENMIRYAKKINCASTQLDIERLNDDEMYYYINLNRIASRSAETGIDYYLTSSANTVSNCAGYLAGEIFKCDPSGDNKFVNICFILGASGSTDTSTTAQGSTGVEFRSQVTLRNWGV